MSKVGKRGPTKTRSRRKSPLFAQNEIPKYLTEHLHKKVELKDGFGIKDVLHDDLYTDEDSWNLLNEHGIEPEAPIYLLLQAIQNGIESKHLASVSSKKSKINKFSQETTIISTILRIREIGTRKNMDEALFREIARYLTDEAVGQINENDDEIEFKLQSAARKAIKKFDLHNELSVNPESMARDLAIRFKRKFEVNMARAIDRPEELTNRLEKLLDAIDVLAKFGVPVDTSVIRSDLKIRQVGPE